jgi:histidine ammonia-lyase
MNEITLGKHPLTIDDVVNIAQGTSRLVLKDDSGLRAKIDKGYNLLTSLLKRNNEVYGVTTGYGDSCTTVIDPELIEQLPINLVRYHGCGLGDFFNEEESRAIQVARIASLTQGSSGVSYELLQFLTDQLNRGITPRIPKEGSVGASGDLTPLSYLAATCIGEGEVSYHGKIYPTTELFKELGIKPVGLKPKEGLAIMNGTAVMTAIACLAFKRAEYLCQLASKITAANTLAICGNPLHFDKFLFDAKPHKGQSQIAEWIRSEFSRQFVQNKAGRLQDRYSIRCAPHVIGVLQDSLYFFKGMIETELNSANDNPLIDVEGERIVHGGNFYGGHIAFAMDSMKVLIANVADLLDRQLAMLVDTKFNNGLEANLSGATKNKGLHHGFKAVQIAASAWTAEALKLSLPASIFSRSTECHNQDKVSMGTIAARDCIRSLELTEQVAAACTFASAQALELRKQKTDLNDELIGPSMSLFQKTVLKEVDFVTEDRRLDKDLRKLVQLIQSRKWNLYV